MSEKSNPAPVSREEWLEARRKLLIKEKELTRLRDELSKERRELPRVRLDKDYTLQSERGEISLCDLFAERSQLLIYHFMFGPDWQEGCPSCSFWADGYNGTLPHLAARDVSFVTVSRAPLSKLLSYRDRMGWSFPWVSSLQSDFNFDFGVSFSEAQLASGDMMYNFSQRSFPSSEAPGLSVFLREGDTILHTYSTYARGLDMLNSVYQHLDLTPRGRDEGELPYPMAWVRRRDQYETPAPA